MHQARRFGALAWLHMPEDLAGHMIMIYPTFRYAPHFHTKDAIVFGDVLRRACIDHPILGTANNKTILPQIVGSSAKHVNRWDFSEHDQPRRAVYHREFWDDS